MRCLRRRFQSGRVQNGRDQPTVQAATQRHCLGHDREQFSRQTGPKQPERAQKHQLQRQTDCVRAQETREYKQQ